MTILIFILILSVLIFVHELGHFFIAKKTGVRVDEFGFGLPPRVFGKKIGETLYSLNLIPLGGFVKLYGEEYHEIKNKNNAKRAFINKKPWQKTLIIIGGVIGNFLLGWVIISFLFTQGVPTPTNKIIVDKISKGSPAVISGLKEKDEIFKMIAEGSSINLTKADDLITLTKKYAGNSISLYVKRGDKFITINVVPRKKPPADEGPLGISISSYVIKKYLWYEAPFYGLVESSRIIKTIVVELSKILYQLVTFQKVKVEVAGPIGIAKYAGSAIKLGVNAVLELLALLSFNLGVINILPFPALDGGRLMFVLFEWITNKKINKNIEKYVNAFGLIILLSLGIFISIFDVLKLLK